jgi:hypothetical protein
MGPLIHSELHALKLGAYPAKNIVASGDEVSGVGGLSRAGRGQPQISEWDAKRWGGYPPQLGC